MKDLSAEERPVIGSLVNVVKAELENLIEVREEEFKKAEINKKLEQEKIDITLPATKVKRGSKHPVNRIIEEIEEPLHAPPVSPCPVIEVHKGPYDEDAILNKSVGHINRQAPDDYIHTDIQHHAKHLLLQVTAILVNMQRTQYRETGPVGREGKHTQQHKQYNLLPLLQREASSAVIIDIQCQRCAEKRPDHAGLIQYRIPKRNHGDPEAEIIGKMRNKCK